MNGARLVTVLSVAAAIGLCVAPGYSKQPAKSARECTGARGFIDVATVGSADLVVTVLAPDDRFARWSVDSMTISIPGCNAEEGIGTEDPEDTSEEVHLNQHLQFSFEQIVQGRYTVQIQAVDDDTAHIFIERSTAPGAEPWKASYAEAEVKLRKGETAMWTLDWGCKQGVDSVWCTLKRSSGSALPKH